MGFITNHKILSGFIGMAIGSQLIGIGWEGIGGPLCFASALWVVIGFCMLFGGGTTRAVGVERINGVNYTVNSPEANAARSRLGGR